MMSCTGDNRDSTVQYCVLVYSSCRSRRVHCATTSLSSSAQLVQAQDGNDVPRSREREAVLDGLGHGTRAAAALPSQPAARAEIVTGTGDGSYTESQFTTMQQSLQ